MRVYENRDWIGEIGIYVVGGGKIMGVYENRGWRDDIGTYGVGRGKILGCTRTGKGGG